MWAKVDLAQNYGDEKCNLTFDECLNLIDKKPFFFISICWKVHSTGITCYAFIHSAVDFVGHKTDLWS